MTANACGCPVLAGPVEATVLGNMAVQLMALGEIPSLAKAREVIKNSVELTVYKPRDTELWDTMYKTSQTLADRSRTWD